jgi:hypothetical protein
VGDDVHAIACRDGDANTSAGTPLVMTSRTIEFPDEHDD